jgi:hypothetical protein
MDSTQNNDGRKDSSSTDPILKKEDVQQSNDEHIDQDFEGYPHHPSREATIKPESDEDLVAARLKESRENRNISEDAAGSPVKKKKIDEIESDGSGGAFTSTENFSEDDDRRRIDDK